MDIYYTQDMSTALDKPVFLYQCGHEKCKPSHSFGPAIRPHYLFHYILHGRGVYYVDGITYHLEGGQGFLIYPGVTTTYTADEEDPWEYCWIGFDGYDTRRILQDCGFSLTNHIFTDPTKGPLWSDFQKLIAYFGEQKTNDYTILSQLYLCFSHMCLRGKQAKLLGEAPVEKALDYIHNNFTYDIKITDIAQYLHVDRTYLYKLFIHHTNTSPQQYLINHRIAVSKKLLQETTLSITEIAFSCGFRDVSSFNKHFKKLMHKTPREFRKCEGSL